MTHSVTLDEAGRWTHGQIRVAMIGLGMIFDETYRSVFEKLYESPLFIPGFGPVKVSLATLVSRTGIRGNEVLKRWNNSLGRIRNCYGSDSLNTGIDDQVDVVCVASPDDRHFEAARRALELGKHVLIEKPSVLSLAELDQLQDLARKKNLLARVVYHKLCDPDHKRLRTLYANNTLRHVNNGYCSLLEPKVISGKQFAEWINGRNPATYVAVHYLKLIDFTFGTRDGSPVGWKLSRITANGQRGLVGPAGGNTWDSVQLQVVYRYDDGREAAFDIHTSWVTPDNFTGYVDQEVQFRFDNAIWMAHQRKRGVEMAIEGLTPDVFKNTPNHHYNTEFLEPWNRKVHRGYGLEVIERFFEEVAHVEYGGPASERNGRLEQVRRMEYADLSADRNTVAIVQAVEEILLHHAAGKPGCQVVVNGPLGGLVLLEPGNSQIKILYQGIV